MPMVRHFINAFCACSLATYAVPEGFMCRDLVVLNAISLPIYSSLLALPRPPVSRFHSSSSFHLLFLFTYLSILFILLIALFLASSVLLLCTFSSYILKLCSKPYTKNYIHLLFLLLHTTSKHYYQSREYDCGSKRHPNACE